jgi:hypothetical protein
MPASEHKIGALWRRETRDNAEYMKGEVEIDGRKVPIVVFKNGYKERSNQPDYIVYRDTPAQVREPADIDRDR